MTVVGAVIPVAPEPDLLAGLADAGVTAVRLPVAGRRSQPGPDRWSDEEARAPRAAARRHRRRRAHAVGGAARPGPARLGGRRGRLRRRPHRPPLVAPVRGGRGRAHRRPGGGLVPDDRPRGPRRRRLRRPRPAHRRRRRTQPHARRGATRWRILRDGPPVATWFALDADWTVTRRWMEALRDGTIAAAALADAEVSDLAGSCRLLGGSLAHGWRPPDVPGRRARPRAPAGGRGPRGAAGPGRPLRPDGRPRPAGHRGRGRRRRGDRVGARRPRGAHGHRRPGRRRPGRRRRRRPPRRRGVDATLSALETTMPGPPHVWSRHRRSSGEGSG